MVGRLRLRWIIGNPNSYNLPNMADALIYGITFFRAQFLLFGNPGMKTVIEHGNGNLHVDA
ncbi:hypothetical protein [uncultured Bilophila sp.]|uniref:hypothetical protein n=1 Tax=uncultured Bilophila sp. TaxID=529385 RepID=UPI00266ECCF3|nr:hypothetical protein [uncultured Bilophila sp.]